MSFRKMLVYLGRLLLLAGFLFVVQLQTPASAQPPGGPANEDSNLKRSPALGCVTGPGSR